MYPRHFFSILLSVFSFALLTLPAAEPDYSVVDSELRAVPIDSDPTESFLGMQLDSAGRLFVGGREALFVYEPEAKGGYQKKQELLRFPNHTWVYDIAIRGNDLYVLTVSALYLIKDGVTQRSGLKAQKLVWGIPWGHVHQCFHGLAIGPEGDIYFSSGDPLWYYGDYSRPDHWGHWTYFSQPEGTKTPFTGVGGVMRCKPDGTGFQVVSRGQRNSCGLAFDAQWNLFSNDNDHEGMPAAYVPGRLLHVTPHAYFSWPRGWLLEKQPMRADLLETMNPNLGRFVPVGQAYYNETFLPEKYRDNLLVARWCTRAVPRFPLTHRGASFKADEVPLFVGRNDARPVSVTVGRGGRIFVSIAYMAHNDASPVYKSDLVMITRADDPDTHPFEAYEETKAPADKLWNELSNPSWWRRYRAHIELVRRGGPLLEEAAKRLVAIRPNDPAAGHLVWLAAANNSPRAADAIGKMAIDSDETLRLQAVRAINEFPKLGLGTNEFKRALTDKNPQVQLAGILGLFDHSPKVPVEIVTGPALSKDTYLRQAATLMLAEKATIGQLTSLCMSSNLPVRLAGVLAAGFRLTIPPVHQVIPPNHTLDASRTNDYIIQLADGVYDLRKFGRVGNFMIADHWNQGPGSPDEEKLFTLLMDRLKDTDEQVRLQAAHFLFLLDDKRSEPLVAKVNEQDERQRLVVSGKSQSIGEAWIAGPFPDGAGGFKTSHSPELEPINLAADYAEGGKKIQWQRMKKKGRHFNFLELFGPCDQSSFYGYFRLESATAQAAMLLIGSDDGVRVWQNGKLVWDNPMARAALPFQDTVMLKLQPGSNELLVRVQNNAGASGLYLDCRTFNEMPVTLPEKTGGLAERLKQGKAGDQPIPAEILQTDWTQEALKGNAENGKKLFQSLACINCHAIKADASGGGGPSLTDARSRFTVPYIVESILAPNKVVSPVFRWTALELKNGEAVNGLMVGETATKVEMLLTDSSHKTIEKTEIKARAIQDKSPMPEGLIRSAAELRDLLTYLLTEKP